MKRTVLAFVLLISVCFAAMAQKYTISGYITDAASGEPIIGAAVIDSKSTMGVVTGNTGFYSISLERGEHSLIFPTSAIEIGQKSSALSAMSN